MVLAFLPMLIIANPFTYKILINDLHFMSAAFAVACSVVIIIRTRRKHKYQHRRKAQ